MNSQKYFSQLAQAAAWEQAFWDSVSRICPDARRVADSIELTEDQAARMAQWMEDWEKTHDTP